jgi:hypothetical protein
MVPALLAAALVALGQLVGWRGVDTAAQVFRVDAFRHSGFVIWDFQWYGGHWTLDYSVLYPALASVTGVAVLAVASAAGAALAFQRLTRPFGRAGAIGSYVFAAGTLVPASIGQLPFLSGEAFGLAAAWAVSRRRFGLAAVLALLATLTTPLAGAFVGLGAAAWLLSAWRGPQRRARIGPAAALMAASLGPVVAAAVLFPGDGPMPYPVSDWAWEMAIAAGLGLLAGRENPLWRAGAVLFMVVATISVLVPSSLGGNVGRIEDGLALPMATVLLWSRPRVLLPVAAVPLALSQWGPAWGALTASSSRPSTHASYFAALDAELRSLASAGPAGRVEVVPTEYHWEAAYVAPVLPLARGWERQLDVADNPIFYRAGALTGPAYRAWLIDNGVRFVALPDAPLDMAGRAEAALIRSGAVTALHQVWRSTHWRLYAVEGSDGIVSQPARLVSATGNHLVVDAPRAGPVVIRVRYSPDWTLDQGAGCVTRSGQSWISVTVPRPEQFTLGLSLLTADSDACPSATVGS